MINLHAIVRKPISAAHPEVPAVLYRSTGQTVGPDGEIKAAYAAGIPVSVQMQSESPTVLAHVDRVGQEEVSRKFYLFSEADPAKRVAGIVRPLSRNGDMLFLEDGAWWLIDAVIEDFSRSGWVSVRATLQVREPDFCASEWFTQDESQ
jgi:hypothetical protein